jgi:hypothetical protein
MAEKGVEISRLRNVINLIIDVAHYDVYNRRIIIDEKDLRNAVGRDILEAIKDK